MSWDKGIEKCKTLGGDLASINSSDEQNVIYSKVYFFWLSKIEVAVKSALAKWG